MKKLLALLLLCSCGGGSTTVQPTSPQPTVAGGSVPVPPVTPPLTPPPIVTQDLDSFFAQSTGRWLQVCKVTGDKTSQKFGLDIGSAGWSFLTFNYPTSNVCSGAPNPNDGSPQTYKAIAVLGIRGWIRMIGNCSGNCAKPSSEIYLQRVGEVLFKKDTIDTPAADSYTKQ